MPPQLWIFLIIGTVLMGVPIGFAAKKYEIPLWRGVIATALLTVTGTLGTLIMYALENGKWGGISFYGAVFLVPVVFLAVAPMLRIPYRELTDLCAIGECIMLALMKVHCLINTCCRGRILFTTAEGTAVRFPSREAELVLGLIIFTILLCWALKGKNRGELYAWYLLIYGCCRFVLNIFRQAWVDKVMLLPFGNIWSIVAVAAGLIWLLVLRRQKTRGVHRE